MSTFDWGAKGPSELTKDHKFNGVNTRKSAVSQKIRGKLPFTNLSHKLVHNNKDSVDEIPKGGTK
jgi:hypothetical protein